MLQNRFLAILCVSLMIASSGVAQTRLSSGERVTSGSSTTETEPEGSQNVLMLLDSGSSGEEAGESGGSQNTLMLLDSGSSEDSAECVARAEVCDGIDNDCDGLIDEDFAVGESCSDGLGICLREGTMQCVAGGELSCSAVAVTSRTGEVCGNQLDDDCDGLVDEQCAEARYRVLPMPTNDASGGEGETTVRDQDPAADSGDTGTPPVSDPGTQQRIDPPVIPPVEPVEPVERVEPDPEPEPVVEAEPIIDPREPRVPPEPIVPDQPERDPGDTGTPPTSDPGTQDRIDPPVVPPLVREEPESDPDVPPTLRIEPEPTEHREREPVVPPEPIVPDQPERDPGDTGTPPTSDPGTQDRIDPPVVPPTEPTDRVDPEGTPPARVQPGGQERVIRGGGTPPGTSGRVRRAEVEGDGTKDALPDFVCRSDELFDCGKTRGWKLPIYPSGNPLMFASHERRGVFYAFSPDGGPLYSLNMNAVPGTDEAERAVECEVTPSIEILQVQSTSRGVVAHDGERYYALEETTVPFGNDGANDCVLHLEEMLFDHHRCDGEILTMRYGVDVSGDGIEDVVSAVACDDPFGAVDDEDNPLAARLEFDLLLGRRDGSFSGHQVLGLSYADPMALSQAELKLDFGDMHDLQAVLNVKSEVHGNISYARHTCSLEFHQHQTPFILCASEENTGESSPYFELFAWKKHNPRKRIALSSAGACQLPKVQFDEETAGNPFANHGKAMRAEIGALEKECASVIDRTVAVEDTLGAFFMPKRNGQWTQGNMLFADQARIRALHAIDEDDVSTVEAMPEEELMCGAPLDGMAWTDDENYGHPRGLTALNLDGHGGDELCTMCTTYINGRAHDAAVICFVNQGEEPTVELHPDSEPLLVEESGKVLRVDIVSDDPTDDELQFAHDFVDSDGKSVRDHLVETGQLVFHADYVEITADMPGVGASTAKGWGGDYVPSIAVPTDKMSEGVEVAWPVEMRTMACDAGNYCAESSLTISLHSKASGPLPEIDEDVELGSPLLADDPLGAEIIGAEDPGDPEMLGAWGMAGGWGCSLVRSEQPQYLYRRPARGWNPIK